MTEACGHAECTQAVQAGVRPLLVLRYPPSVTHFKNPTERHPSPQSPPPPPTQQDPRREQDEQPRPCMQNVSTVVDGARPCLVNALHSPCTVCAKDMSTSAQPLFYMHCGHAMHYDCFTANGYSGENCPQCPQMLSDISVSAALGSGAHVDDDLSNRGPQEPAGQVQRSQLFVAVDKFQEAESQKEEAMKEVLRQSEEIQRLRSLLMQLNPDHEWLAHVGNIDNDALDIPPAA